VVLLLRRAEALLSLLLLLLLLLFLPLRSSFVDVVEGEEEEEEQEEERNITGGRRDLLLFFCKALFVDEEEATISLLVAPPLLANDARTRGVACWRVRRRREKRLRERVFFRFFRLQTAARQSKKGDVLSGKEGKPAGRFCCSSRRSFAIRGNNWTSRTCRVERRNRERQGRGPSRW